MTLTPVEPFEPIRCDRAPQGEQWTAQVKWDGVRMLSYYDGNAVRLVNRNLNDRTLKYPEFTDPGLYGTSHSFILDGEFIAFDEQRPAFHAIMKRDRMKVSHNIKRAVQSIPVTYMVFDLLYYNGQWVIDQPLASRQNLLRDGIQTGSSLQLVDNVSDGAALFQLMEQYGMEGIVYKDLNSAYTIAGKDKRWQKQKVIRDLIAVVGGVTYRGNRVNALLLGLYDDKGELRYIGHAGTGKLTQEDWRVVTVLAAELKQDRKPFVNRTEREQEAVWLRPELTVKVNYAEWTPRQSLRQPSIQSFVEVPLDRCRFDQQ